MRQLLDKKNVFLIIIVTAAIASAIYLTISETPKAAKVVIKDREFIAEISDTNESRAKGLGQRDGIEEGNAMLFVFPQKGKYGFWMKDMRFDIDILWISEGKIVYMAKNVSFHYRGTIVPDTDADYVLEIRSGLSDTYGFTLGDRVEIALPK
jgi:uncharacterized protein